MPSAIVAGTNSWVTEAEANTFLGDRLDADTYWIDDEPDNTRALLTAYNWLNNSGRFDFPDVAVQIMKDAQCEYALFLLQHQPDIDLRMGLISQGVVKAGVVKEEYDRKETGIPIPPFVSDMLSDYQTQTPFYIFDIERDEEQETDYNAPGNLTRNT